jgi:hypothetical protein
MKTVSLEQVGTSELGLPPRAGSVGRARRLGEGGAARAERRRRLGRGRRADGGRGRRGRRPEGRARPGAQRGAARPRGRRGDARRAGASSWNGRGRAPLTARARCRCGRTGTSPTARRVGSCSSRCSPASRDGVSSALASRSAPRSSGGHGRRRARRSAASSSRARATTWSGRSAAASGTCGWRCRCWTGSSRRAALGLRHGSSENATVAKQPLSNLVARGLDTGQGVLCVIDGAEPLRKAIDEVLGPVPVQRRSRSPGSASAARWRERCSVDQPVRVDGAPRGAMRKERRDVSDSHPCRL